MTGDFTSSGTPGSGWWQPDAHADGVPLPPAPDPLWRVLFCAGCGQQFFGDDQFSGARVLYTACPCRPRPIPADEVDQRVYAEVHALVFGTDPVTGLTKTHYVRLAVRLFSRVEIGLTADDITFTARS